MNMRRSEFSPAVRLQAKHRAKYRCETCGSKTDLELHHIGGTMDRSAVQLPSPVPELSSGTTA